MLSQYYRHLFLTVKFVGDSDISYKEKRHYLRILRASLSNDEQLMLFYNWHYEYGSQWENDKNRFFTDYRMIHNIRPDDVVDNVDIRNILSKLIKDKYIKKEKGSKEDYLFELDDEETASSFNFEECE